jgi:transcriptional regulator with XRE-family HTH domain
MKPDAPPTTGPDSQNLEPDEGANPGELMWRPAPGFGTFLRQRREARGMTLREAADELGITYTRLQKMETGGRYRAPSLSLLTRIAILYLLESSELFKAAGLDFSIPTPETLEADIDRDFEAITLHPDLAPVDFDEIWCKSFSQLQKQQWLDFAFKVEAYQLAHGPIVTPILAEAAKRHENTQPTADEDVEQTMLNAIEGTVIGGGFLYWKFKAGFGPYLRRLREERKLTLKSAAASLGLNFSALQRLETGDERPPTVELLRAIAYLYGVHIEEVMREAGVNERAVTILYRLEAWNANFSALVTHPELRPGDMNPRWIQSFSGVQQRQWVEFAVHLESYIRAGKPRLKALIAAWKRAREGTSVPSKASSAS